jgi:rhamnose transport system permease protein
VSAFSLLQIVPGALADFLRAWGLPLATLCIMAAVTTAAQPAARRSAARFFLRWEWMLVLLIVLLAVLNSSLSPYFLRFDNLMRASRDYVEIGVMMLAMVFVIITGGIDLAVASTLALTASFMGWLFNAGWNIWGAAALAIVLGIGCGALNGFLISRVKLPPLVVTLGTFAFYRGMAYVLLGDQAARGYPASFLFIGQGRLFGDLRVPFALLLFFGLAIVFGLLLHKTAFGRKTFAIGNNEEACRYSGVPVARTKMTIYILSGLMASLAGIIMASRFGSTRPDIATGMELDVITATVLGGISISGGSGTMMGAVLALILIAELKFGMGLLNVQGQVQGVVIGMMLILAILLPNLGRTVGTRGLNVSARGLALAAGAIALFGVFVWFFFWSRGIYLASL